MGARTFICPPRQLRRADARAIRARAWEIAQQSYQEHLAQLLEIAESRGVRAALEWSPRDAARDLEH